MTSINYLPSLYTWHLARIATEHPFDLIAIPLGNLYPHPFTTTIASGDGRFNKQLLTGRQSAQEGILEGRQLSSSTITSSA